MTFAMLCQNHHPALVEEEALELLPYCTASYCCSCMHPTRALNFSQLSWKPWRQVDEFSAMSVPTQPLEGFHYDELSKIRVIDPAIAGDTSELKEECKEFVDSKIF